MTQQQLPPGAIALPSDLMQEGARFGLSSARALCELMGHLPIKVWPNAEAAARYRWPIDFAIGLWCFACGEWRQ